MFKACVLVKNTPGINYFLYSVAIAYALYYAKYEQWRWFNLGKQASESMERLMCYRCVRSFRFKTQHALGICNLIVTSWKVQRIECEHFFWSGAWFFEQINIATGYSAFEWEIFWILFWFWWYSELISDQERREFVYVRELVLNSSVWDWPFERSNTMDWLTMNEFQSRQFDSAATSVTSSIELMWLCVLQIIKHEALRFDSRKSQLDYGRSACYTLENSSKSINSTRVWD